MNIERVCGACVRCGISHNLGPDPVQPRARSSDEVISLPTWLSISGKCTGTFILTVVRARTVEASTAALGASPGGQVGSVNVDLLRNSLFFHTNLLIG